MLNPYRAHITESVSDQFIVLDVDYPFQLGSIAKKAFARILKTQMLNNSSQNQYYLQVMKKLRPSAIRDINCLVCFSFMKKADDFYFAGNNIMDSFIMCS